MHHGHQDRWVHAAGRFILILAGVAASALGQSASSSTILGAGYLYAAPINIAPGQVITIFAVGVGSTLKQPVLAGAGNLPTSLAGISVTIAQATQISAPILEVAGPVTCQNCAAITAITIQIPYELQMPPANGGLEPANVYSVTANGVAGSWNSFNPVPDQVHILTTCDTVLGGAGTPRCPWEVTHANGQLVSTTNPASEGEELVAYAVGLGPTNPAVPTGQAATQPTPTAQTFRLGFNFTADAPPSAPPLSPSQPPSFTGLTPNYPGLYQINFIVPNVPTGLPACAGQGPNLVNTNLTVNVGGVASFDGAEICVSLPD